MKGFCKVTFMWLLNQTDLDPILSVSNPEVQVQMLTAALEAAADVCAPYRNICVKKNHTKWMSEELREMINSRDAWYREFT